MRDVPVLSGALPPLMTLRTVREPSAPFPLGTDIYREWLLWLAETLGGKIS